MPEEIQETSELLAPQETSLTDETLREEPQETVEEPQDTGEQPPVKDDDPQGFQKRINEIYGKMKHYERESQEKENILKELKEHNKKLAERIYGVEDQVLDARPAPDPVEDPEGYSQWVRDKIQRDLEREKRQKELEELSQTIQQPVQQQPQQQTSPILAAQIAAMEAQYDDYNAMIIYADKDIKNDAVLRNEIYQSENPAKAAYNYAVKKFERNRVRRKEMGQQSFVEDSSPSPPPKTKELTDAELKVARALGIKPEDYKKQKEYIGGV